MNGEIVVDAKFIKVDVYVFAKVVLEGWHDDPLVQGCQYGCPRASFHGGRTELPWRMESVCLCSKTLRTQGQTACDSRATGYNRRATSYDYLRPPQTGGWRASAYNRWTLGFSPR